MTQSLFPEPAVDAVRVALPVPTDDLFDYAVPEGLRAAARPGCRAQVPLGARTLTGVIVERTAAPSHRRLRSLRKIVDPEPVLSDAMLTILREEAAAVLCPPGIALAAALPAGSAPRVSRGYALTPRGRAALAAGGVPEPARDLLETLAEAPRPLAQLRRRPGAALLPGLEADGLVAPRGLEQAPAARAATRRVAELAPGVDAEAALAGALARAPRQAELVRRLARGPVPVETLCGESRSAGALLRALEARGLVAVRREAAPRDVLGAAPPADAELPLTPDQAEALGPIADAVRRRQAQTFLLHGVTGSGKTEVYLRAVGEALRSGRQALVLVPEITLTHQILARLRARFGDRLAVLHSGLRPGERLEQWQRLRGGATPIAVGARSALFAPLENLGVIVIDEEHDDAYKNEEGFRYHARDLAARRSAAAACPLVLGSATPSLETRFAADRGELRRLVLPRRIGGRPLPAVEIVDLRRERELMPRGRKLILSLPLQRALAQTLRDGAQTILLLNRRGFSTQILCFRCGHAERCPNCDLALVYHAAEQALICHTCNHRAPPPEVCAGCGDPSAALLGLGTERLEEDVRARFPEARIARLDRDTAQQRGLVERVLRELRQGRLDVLIGTQMVAKGHDFPGVRLVGVVLADTGLHLPDFRAAERSFQLLTQVAGRAGRDLAPGRVVIQTYAPDHYAIRRVIDHDYEGFYAEELGHRAALGYPPFGRLVHVLVSGPELDATLREAHRLAEAAKPAAGIELLGPAPAPRARLRGRHRVQLVLKGAHEADVLAAARRMRDAGRRLPDGVHAVVDPRPIDML